MQERLAFDELCREFKRVLDKYGFPEEKGVLCARIFAENTRDGVLSHGINRFGEFIDYVRRGLVKVEGEPVRVDGFGAFERWDGQQGPGMLNAHFCMARAIELAGSHALGCVVLRNTNHWMRAGTYGLQAADAGCIGICWTNTRVLMPAWGGRDPRVGNNPLVICVPRGVPDTPGFGVLGWRDGEHVLLDMSMSQFSFGRMLIAERTGEKLPVPGGFDEAGNLTDDAAQILRSQRPLPIGYWKGSGLAFLLDSVVAVLAAGQASFQIGAMPDETRVSQLFLAIDLEKTGCSEYGAQLMEQVVADLRSAAPLDPGKPVTFPGERMRQRREENLRHGTLVDSKIWQRIKTL